MSVKSIHSTSDINEKDEKQAGITLSTLEGVVPDLIPDFDEDGVPEYDWGSDEFKDIPELVRTVVSFEDDPTLPAITFRAILLSSLFIAIGSFVSQLS